MAAVLVISFWISLNPLIKTDQLDSKTKNILETSTIKLVGNAPKYQNTSKRKKQGVCHAWEQEHPKIANKYLLEITEISF